jgi:hypothetical protein
MKLLLATAPLLLAGACIPHSAAVGQTAVPIATGGAEVAMSIGVAQSRNTVYENDGDPAGPQEDTMVQTQLPAIESNFLYGLGEQLGLNLHASSAGLQPGLKITVVNGPELHVALLPAFGIGVFSQSDPDDAGSTGSFDSITILAGGRVLLSSTNGVYGALGYDFQRTSADDPDTGEEAATYDFHRMTGAIGCDIHLGKGFHVRPEMAVLYGLAGTATDESTMGVTQEADLDSLVLFPSVTFAVQTN